jgi:hypothetical protein
MDTYFANTLTAAGIASGAAILATIGDGFRNILAASFAVAGGGMPWLVVALLFHWPSNIALLVALFSIAPLFLMALFFYSLGKPGFARSMAVAMMAVGVFSSLIFSALVGYPFLVSDYGKGSLLESRSWQRA